MELIKGIKERRSTRKFTDQAVSEEEIRAIVSAAAYAPSWKNTSREEDRNWLKNFVTTPSRCIKNVQSMH